MAILEAEELFHTSDQVAYVSRSKDGHRETYALESAQVRYWLITEYYARHHTPMPPTALTSALVTATARAVNDGPERAVYKRLGGADDKVYVDLADATWAVVCITPGAGWSITPDCPLRFVRPRGCWL